MFIGVTVNKSGGQLRLPQTAMIGQRTLFAAYY